MGGRADKQIVKGQKTLTVIQPRLRQGAGFRIKFIFHYLLHTPDEIPGIKRKQNTVIRCV